MKTLICFLGCIVSFFVVSLPFDGFARSDVKAVPLVYDGYPSGVKRDVNGMPLYHKNAPIMAGWEKSGSQGYLVSSGRHQYLIGVQEELREPEKKTWGVSLRLYGASPFAYMWLDGAYMKRVGVLPQDGGDPIVGDRIIVETLEHPSSVSPLGRIRVTLYEQDDAVVLVREMETLMIPVPSSCDLFRRDPWHVGDREESIGERMIYRCGDVQITGFYSRRLHLVVLQIWGHKDGKKFVALTLENDERVVMESSDTFSPMVFDAEKNILRLQLYTDEKSYMREITLE